MIEDYFTVEQISSLLKIHPKTVQRYIREGKRILNTLTASLNAKPPGFGQSSMQSQYIERENMVRITLWGDFRFMAIMMDTVMALLTKNMRCESI